MAVRTILTQPGELVTLSADMVLYVLYTVTAYCLPYNTSTVTRLPCHFTSLFSTGSSKLLLLLLL